MLCCIFTHLRLVKIWPHTHAISSHISMQEWHGGAIHAILKQNLDHKYTKKLHPYIFTYLWKRLIILILYIGFIYLCFNIPPVCILFGICHPYTSIFIFFLSCVHMYMVLAYSVYTDKLGSLTLAQLPAEYLSKFHCCLLFTGMIRYCTRTVYRSESYTAYRTGISYYSYTCSWWRLRCRGIRY